MWQTWYKAFWICLILKTCAISQALLLSLIGDILFIFCPNEFAYPILFFSLSHMAYALRAGAKKNYRLYCCLLITAILLSIRHLNIQIVLYSLLLISNFFQSLTWDRYYLIGYYLFIISDILLAYRDFISRYPGDDLIALTTYFLAQIVLAGPPNGASMPNS